MHVKQVTKLDASLIFARYGMDVVLWTSSSMTTGAHQGIVCDYTKLSGYTVAYACEVIDCRSGHQVERFNVMR